MIKLLTVSLFLNTGLLLKLALPSFFKGSECNSYFVNQETDRSVSYVTGPLAHKCDKNQAAGWYRFNSTAGSKMPTNCIRKNRCNTHASGWLNGTHPTPQEGIVNRTVCFNWNSKCCNWQTSIRVRNCGLFFVYYLTKPITCHLRYCVTNWTFHLLCKHYLDHGWNVVPVAWILSVNIESTNDLSCVK